MKLIEEKFAEGQSRVCVGLQYENGFQRVKAVITAVSVVAYYDVTNDCLYKLMHGSMDSVQCHFKKEDQFHMLQYPVHYMS